MKGSCDINTMDVEDNPSYFFIFLVSFDGVCVCKICTLGKWTNELKNANTQEVAIAVFGQV